MSLQSLAVPAENMKIITAASGNQISSTYEEKGHGLFTYFLLKEIQSRAKKDNTKLGIGDMYQSIKPEVEQVARKIYNNEQTPQLIMQSE
jgi:hypothetical protein